MSDDFPSDRKTLLARAVDKDLKALEDLLEKERFYLALLARQQIGAHKQRKMDASDVVQDALLLAYRDFYQFRGITEQEWAAWLRRILSNCLAKKARRREHEVEQEINQSSKMLELLADSTTSPSNKVANRERATLLADKLQKLPEHYREVILLHQLQGLNFPEVADRMDKSIDAVKHYWSRALKELRILLKDALE